MALTLGPVAPAHSCHSGHCIRNQRYSAHRIFCDLKFHSSASTQWMCCDYKYRISDSSHGIFFTGGDGRWLLTGAHNLVQNSGKRTLFPQIRSDNDAKNYRLKFFSDIFDLHVWETRWPKQVQQISWNALLKHILELVACDIHQADKYWIIVGQKVTFLTVYTMFLEKYSFVCLRDQAILIGAWGRCKCKLSYEKKKIMPHGKKTMKNSIRPMADSKKKSPSPMTFYHFYPILWDKIFYIAVNRILFIGTVVKKIRLMIVFAVLAARGVRFFFFSSLL